MPFFGQKFPKNPKFDILGHFWPFFGRIIDKIKFDFFSLSFSKYFGPEFVKIGI